MTDISNKTLAILVGIAIVVSIFGILSVPRGGVTIIGAAVNTTTGVANVTINTVTLIRLKNNTVDFGAGFVNTSGTSCTMESNNTVASRSTACEGFRTTGNNAIFDRFVIENAGNVNVTLDINGQYADARAFMCNSTNTAQNCSTTPEYNFSADNFEAV